MNVHDLYTAVNKLHAGSFKSAAPAAKELQERERLKIQW